MLAHLFLFVAGGQARGTDRRERTLARPGHVQLLVWSVVGGERVLRPTPLSWEQDLCPKERLTWTIKQKNSQWSVWTLEQCLKTIAGACLEKSTQDPQQGLERGTLRPVALLPGRWGLPCPAVCSTWHDPASPLTGARRPRSLAFAIPRLGPLHLHLNKETRCSVGRGCVVKLPPSSLSHTPIIYT